MPFDNTNEIKDWLTSFAEPEATPPASNPRMADVLRRAREIIAGGRCAAGMGNLEDTFCIIAANNKAARDLGFDRSNDEFVVHNAFRVGLPERGLGLVRFNEDPTTTDNDVLAAYDRAIAAAEA